MNNKKLTYLLIIVVAFVWGIIFYRIFSGAGNDSNMGIKPNKIKVNSEIDVEKDSIVLIASYKDPFLGRTTGTVTPRAKTPEKKTITRRTSRIKRIKWPAIKYGGIIKSHNKDNQIALINIDNKNKLMYEKDLFKEVKLERIFNDSIHVRFKEETKTIFKAK